jgi:hypothetical protein
MAKWLTSISSNVQGFIEKQKMFFVATAAKDGKVNVSPKGLDTLKVMDKNKVIWLNLGGSGNETETHLADTNRMTLMFCSFDGGPLIVRLYGTAKSIRPENEAWEEMILLFPNQPRARQIFEMEVVDVQTSCGYGVPFFNFEGQREPLSIPKVKK